MSLVSDTGKFTNEIRIKESCPHRWLFIGFGESKIDGYSYRLWQCSICGEYQKRNIQYYRQTDPEGGFD